jgi:hypothetical protein
MSQNLVPANFYTFFSLRFRSVELLCFSPHVLQISDFESVKSFTQGDELIVKIKTLEQGQINLHFESTDDDSQHLVTTLRDLSDASKKAKGTSKFCDSPL